MRCKTAFLLCACACLLAACGRVGEDPQRSPQAALERPPQPAVAAVQDKPQEPARVPMPAPEALTDAAITERIATELKADPAMRGADVSINTDNGVVVLSGTVKSHEQTGVASAHAQRQDGVLRVDNHLRPQYS